VFQLQNKVSIIMVSLNSVKTIEKSILSVINQTYSNIEFIIIDGLSKDGTQNVLKKYKDKIDKYISEPDNGLWDAMNKGINNVTGEWLYFLGSDDCLFDCNTIESIIIEINCKNKLVILGDVKFDNGKVFKSDISFKTNLINTIHHQSAFYNIQLFNNFRYDQNYNVMSDYELSYMIYKKKVPYVRVNCIVSHFSTLGISSAGSNIQDLIDMIDIRSKYIIKIINYLFFVFALINHFRKRMI